MGGRLALKIGSSAGENITEDDSGFVVIFVVLCFLFALISFKYKDYFVYLFTTK